MSQSQELPRVTVYSDEASMDNGTGNSGVGDVIPLALPQEGREEERGLVPQPPLDLMPQLPMGRTVSGANRPAHPLFDGRQLFVNAPQYHWHVHGAEGVDV